MDNHVVMVTGVSGETGLGIINGLRELDPGPFVVGVDYTADNAGFQVADLGVQVPGIDDPSYVETLRTLAQEHRVDVLFLGVDGEIKLLAPHRASFAAIGCQVAVSEPEFIRACSDKLLTVEFLAAHGLDVPVTRVADGDVDEVLTRFSLPVVVKPRQGNGSRGVEIVSDGDRLRERWPDLGAAYCVQEYIDGPEYTVSVLFDRDGVMRDSLVMRRNLIAGRTMQSHVERHPGIEAFLERFADIRGMLGSINLQLRVDQRGRVRVFEINPRFSGSTAMRVAAGYNEPARLFTHLVTGKKIEADRPVACSIYRHWSQFVVTRPDPATPIETIDAVVWDCGDTMLELRPSRETIGLRALDELGLRPARARVAEAYRRVDFALAQRSSALKDEHSRRTFMRQYNGLVAQALGCASHADRFDAVAYEMFRELRSWQPVPGLPEFLERASRRFPMYVVANWDAGLRELLESHDLAKYFLAIHDSQSVGTEKPDPEIFQRAARASDWNPNRSVYIGNDYGADVVGCRQVGMTPVLLDWDALYGYDVDCRYARTWDELATHLGVS